MKRWIPWIVAVAAVIWVLRGWMPARVGAGEKDWRALGTIPVLAGGRVKPLDTVARNSLLIIHGRQTVRLADGGKLTPIQWLADVLFRAPTADDYPVFIINHPDVLGMFGWEQGDRKFFSYKELEPFLQKIDTQGQASAELEAPQRSGFQSAILNLRNSLILYQRLKNSIQPERTADFTGEIEAYFQALPSAGVATGTNRTEAALSQEKRELVRQLVGRYESLARDGYLLTIPPVHTTSGLAGDWHNTGATLLGMVTNRTIHPVLQSYAQMGDAYRAGEVSRFNQHVRDVPQWMAAQDGRESSRAAFEVYFNHGAPFYQSMCLYVLAFVLVCMFWLGSNPVWNRTAFLLLLVALAVHTAGLISRMVLQGRPPVTNLYSSAVFIGWGTVIIGLILERLFRDGVGSACAAVIGFVTLIIAHHLAESGDTLEMLQAVLDTNIWLATHVVVVTLGYAAMFLAGMLAIIYVVRGCFTRSLTVETARKLTGMTYGVICFATLFSFVGTVLGGIWADQSWGRFWGWDPKENGALLIVLWCAVILHARWGGMIRQRGLMAMALFGNIITSFSWFGVNMLGVGLHSYGFMSKAFPWLIAFVISQLVLMALALLPPKRWRSSL